MTQPPPNIYIVDGDNTSGENVSETVRITNTSEEAARTPQHETQPLMSGQNQEESSGGGAGGYGSPMTPPSTSALRHRSRTGSSGGCGTPGAINSEGLVPIQQQSTRSYLSVPKTIHNDPTLTEVLEHSNLTGSTRVFQNYQNQYQDENAVLLNWSYRSAGGRGGGAVLGDDEFLSWVGGDDSASALDDINNNKEDSVESSSGQQQQVLKKTTSFGQSVRIMMQKVNRGFFADARSLTEGTIPQSVVLALVIGILCGVACFCYYWVLMYLLELIWHRIPEHYIVGVWPEEYHVLWIPIVAYTCCICVGICVIVLGEPGDLPFTIACIHEKAFIPMDHVIPMVAASIFSVISGGSLGPEAPLVAICGALGGFVSRRLFGQSHKNVIRKHSLMGMAGALAAFFGSPLGGSLFALEVNSRFGVEYYEHMVESIFCGEICLVVFRMLSGLSIAPIWNIYTHNNAMFSTAAGVTEATAATAKQLSMMTHAEPWTVIVGGGIGLLGAAMGYVFCFIHWTQMATYEKFGLLDNKYAIYRAMVGGLFIVIIGMLIPHTMFWDEFEYEQLVTMAPSSELPHVWPTSGLIGFEMNTPGKAFLVGFCKLITISCTVAAGLRGGFIFPLFAAGGIFGRALLSLFPPHTIPIPVAILCFSAGVNVAITRTSLATTLILAFLAGEPCAIPAILAASLCSLFATAYVPFIKTQIARSDIDHSLYHQQRVSYDVNT